MSSASRMGSYIGNSAAATNNATCFVRAAMADASTSGEGRKPSGDAWCSDNAITTQPRVSAHSAISIAAA